MPGWAANRKWSVSILALGMEGSRSPPHVRTEREPWWPHLAILAWAELVALWQSSCLTIPLDSMGAEVKKREKTALGDRQLPGAGPCVIF